MEFDSSFFDAGLERRHTDCEKWDGMVDEHHDPEMIPMWVADMDFRSAPAIADAVKRVAEQGTWGYTLSGEQDARALCDYWKRRHGVGFEPKDVQMGPCVVSELRLCVRALTEPGDGVRYAGRGYMRRAVDLVLDFAFGELRLHRVEAACIPGNERSLGLLEKAGFVREGYARRYLLIDGRWQDHVLLSRTAEEEGG